MASATEIARALTAGSIRSSNSTTSAESPAGTTRKSITPNALSAGAGNTGSPLARLFPLASVDRAERPQQLLMDPAESAVRHQDDEIALSMLANDRADNPVEGFGFAGAAATAGQIADKLRNRQPLRLGQLRAKHRCNHDFVGGIKRPGEIVLEDATAR